MSKIDKVSIHSINKLIFNRNYRDKNKPVIITGAFDNVIPLDINKLNTAIGNMEVPIRFLGPNHFNKPKTEWKLRAETRIGKLNDYCELIQSGEAKRNNIYISILDITNTDLYKLVGKGFDLLEIKTGLKQSSPINTNLWFAPSGHIEPLHFDGLDGTLVQLRGTKKVSLFHPKFTKSLYPFSIFEKKLPPTFSKVYIDSPEHDKYPKLKIALEHRIDVVLEEGDSLYIPVGWWHEIKTLGDDYITSINRFWNIEPKIRMLAAKRASLFYILSKLSIKI